MSRTVNVVRMQLINRQTYIWVPLLVLGGAFLLTLAIYAMLESAGVTGEKYGGGAQAPLWYFCVVGVQSLTLSFPFSQAMSVTRREFYIGTLLTAAASSLVLASVYVVGGAIENATGGWGLNGYFFYLPWVWEGGPAVALVFWFTAAMLVFVSGFWAATIYKRAGTIAVTLVLVGLGALLVLWMYLVGRMDAWAEVFTWFATQGALGLALWGLLLGAVLAGVSYLTLRRAVP
ncbi:hypothetical protein MK786_07745 [Microbacterium sp. CFH 31415]|uniref:hypothetical protein n=1 Tax=Microbacterium sp. CFH 31415 TaxID=2921732 RepID=UPI001F1304C6|nr:hypothetical protein [Microbacterium sp. CFH 31415]MCH6230629.1 hypothetical protein [Microbacterium sp. CFH 31415]